MLLYDLVRATPSVAGARTPFWVIADVQAVYPIQKLAMPFASTGLDTLMPLDTASSVVVRFLVPAAKAFRVPDTLAVEMVSAFAFEPSLLLDEAVGVVPSPEMGLAAFVLVFRFITDMPFSAVNQWVLEVLLKVPFAS